MAVFFFAKPIRTNGAEQNKIVLKITGGSMKALYVNMKTQHQDVLTRGDNPGIGISGSRDCINPESRDYKLRDFRDPDFFQTKILFGKRR